MPDRVLGHLDQHAVAAVQGLLDPPGLPAEPGRVPVHLTGVEHRVAAPADVHERGLHAGQHVLHPAQVDVADQGLAGATVPAAPRHPATSDEVLDQDVVLEHPDLDPVPALAHDHGPVHRLAAGQELGLGQDRHPAPAGVAAVPAALALGLQPGRAAHALHAVAVVPAVAFARLSHPDHRVRRIRVAADVGVLAVAPAAAPTAAPT